LLTGDNASATISDSDIARNATAPTFSNNDFPTLADINSAWTSCEANATATGTLVTDGGSNSSNGTDWSSPYPTQTIFGTMVPPNPIYHTCTFGGAYGLCADRDGIIPARSRHTGGVQATMGDGSVRFISNNIDTLTWQRAGARSDGNSLGEF
jgi:prepilin-type processing-associated H-X9-DG protein